MKVFYSVLIIWVVCMILIVSCASADKKQKNGRISRHQMGAFHGV